MGGTAVENFYHEIIKTDARNPVQIFLHQGPVNYSVLEHWHRSLEIDYLLDCNVFFWVNGEKKLGKAGDLLLINSRDIHALAAGQHCVFRQGIPRIFPVWVDTIRKNTSERMSVYETTEKVIFYAAGAVLLLIFTFTDLQISMTIANKNLWARVLEVIGELPFTFLSIFSCAVLIRFRSKKKLASGISLVGFGLLFLLFSFMGGMMTWNYLKNNLGDGVPKFLMILIAVLLAAGAVFLAEKVQNDHIREAVTFAVITLIYFAVVLVVMNVIKAGWGRMRFREMTDPLTQFTPWYVTTNRGGFSDIYASFPSGHSMNASAVVLFSLFPAVFPSWKGKEKIVGTAITVWILLVGTSRVVMGAHFASDVTMGVLLSITLFWIIRAAVCKIRRCQI